MQMKPYLFTQDFQPVSKEITFPNLSSCFKEHKETREEGPEKQLTLGQGSPFKLPLAARSGRKGQGLTPARLSTQRNIAKPRGWNFCAGEVRE